MLLKRRVLTVGTTFLLAAATGHVMQSGDTISARLNGKAAMPQQVAAAVPVFSTGQAASTTDLPSQPAVVKTAPVPAVQTTAKLPEFPSTAPQILKSASLVSATFDSGTGNLLADLDEAEAIATVGLAKFEPVCRATRLTLGTVAPAMLRLSVNAPCHPNERLKVEHAGLLFSVRTDYAGNYQTLIPAMNAQGSVAITLDGQERLMAARNVPDLHTVTRTALQWRGRADFHLNAFAPGAKFGSAGHINFAAPGDPQATDSGFLTLLGDPNAEIPLQAEVFTAPKEAAFDALQIEAEVTETFCGRALMGQTLSVNAAADPEIAPLIISMPPCDAVGGYVVMNMASIAVIHPQSEPVRR